MSGTPGKTFTVGSLVYTRAGLVSLFGWLIWGDFMLTMMEQVLPNLLPLLLKANQATDSEIVIIVTTMYLAMNVVMNPIISYNSDRFRSRWGRRRPFIVVTTPFVVIFLAAIPYAPEIFHWLSAHGWIARLLAHGPWPPLIMVFAVFVVAFQTFNLFVNSVYFYLIPDVVPLQLIGRFYALFRVFGNLAAISFNYFVFGLAATHMKMIFVITALVYGFFILMMCWRVKEGEYPPPLKEDHGHWWSGIRNYARECFGKSYYWWVFCTGATGGWAAISTVFSVFFYRDDLHMSLGLIGRMTAWGLMLFVVLAYPFGILLDRWGCQKTLILGLALMTAFSVLTFFFAVNQISAIFWTVLRTVPMALVSLAMGKWNMEIYPRDRYGQYCSAAAMFASGGGIILGPLCGYWMGWVHNYRYFFAWSAVFSLIGLIAANVVYSKWKALGGRENYQAP